MTRGSRVLVVTAVAAERDAVLRGLPDGAPFDVLVGGVGPAGAAAGAAGALAGRAGEYGLVLSAGIGGGFPGRAPLGSLALADALVAADLGADSPDGFLPVEELGFGTSVFRTPAAVVAALADGLRAAGLPVAVGPVLTVSTATGTAGRAAELVRRHPGAVAEAMEGCGVAEAAARHGLPAAELRAVSNEIGPRDRSAWRIGPALAALSEAFGAVGRVPLKERTDAVERPAAETTEGAE